jgi:hypothetical protein
MKHKPHVFGYENEPSHERPSGFVRTSFEQSTVGSTWEVSQQSTFDQPSRAVRNRHGRQVRTPFVPTLALVAAAAAVAVAAAFTLLR